MKLQVRRGLAASLPTSGLLVGELLLATDTGYLYIATSATTTVQFAKLADITALSNNVYTKAQIDQLIQGLDWKTAVRVASISDVPALTGLLTIDGVTLVAGDRVLLKDQATASLNGIYIAGAGAWTRSTDADTAAEFDQLAVFVKEGTTNADCGFVCINNGAITLGTTSISFVQFTGAGQIGAGLGLKKTGNTLDIDFTEFGVQTSVAATDYFIIQTATGPVRVLKQYVMLDTDTKTVKNSATDTTAKFLSQAIVAQAGGGLVISTINPGASEQSQFSFDFANVTAGTVGTLLATDKVLVNIAGQGLRWVTAQDALTNLVIDGGTF